MVIFFCQATRPEGTIESFYTTGKREKIDLFYCGCLFWSCQTIFAGHECYYHFCACREAKPSLSEEEFESGIQKRGSDKLQNFYLEKKRYKVTEIRDFEWCDHVQENSNLKSHPKKIIIQTTPQQCNSVGDDRRRQTNRMCTMWIRS